MVDIKIMQSSLDLMGTNLSTWAENNLDLSLKYQIDKIEDDEGKYQIGYHIKQVTN